MYKVKLAVCLTKDYKYDIIIIYRKLFKFKFGVAMRYLLVVLLVVISLSSCITMQEIQTKEINVPGLSSNWWKEADTAYVYGDYYIAIGKGQSIDLATSKNIASMNASSQIMRLAKKHKASISNTIYIAEKCFLEKDGSYTRYLAVKVKKINVR
ncbi:MAG: hypothetical protein ABIG10_01145 [bacterium]